MSLILNFSPIHFEDQEIAVGRLPYGTHGEETLKSLRREYWATHVFKREGDSIAAVPVVVGAPIIGCSESIRLKEHLGLVAALIRNALLQGVCDMGRKSIKYEPMQVISRRDLLRLSCPPCVAPPNWLGVRCLYEISVRRVSFSNRDPIIAAMPKVRTTRIIERTAAELMAEGICLRGFYVGRTIPRDDARIADEFELLGCVSAVEGFQLRLTDYRDGFEIVDARTVKPANDAFAVCLSHVFKERTADSPRFRSPILL